MTISADEKVVAAYLERRAKITKVVKGWTNFSYMQLHAGEMTAQEKRTVRAVLDAILREIETI